MGSARHGAHGQKARIAPRISILQHHGLRDDLRVLLGVRLDVSLCSPLLTCSKCNSDLNFRMLTNSFYSNVVLTLPNGGKAGTIYMLIVAIFGLFFVCLCEYKL